MKFTEDELGYLINTVADHANDILEKLHIIANLAEIHNCINQLGAEHANCILGDLVFGLKLQQKLWAYCPIDDERKKAERILIKNLNSIQETKEFFEGLPTDAKQEKAECN